MKKVYAWQRLERSILLLCVVLVVVYGAWRQWMLPMDRLLYDTFSSLSFDAKQPDDILIIAIDEYSVSELGRWPWERQQHARLLEQLHTSGAGPVLFDIIFSDPDVFNPSSDQAFVGAINQYDKVVLPIAVEAHQKGGQVLELLPDAAFIEAGARLGHVHVETDSDGVVRSVFLKEGVGTPYWSHVSIEMLKLAGIEPPLEGRVQEFLIDDSAMVIRRNFQNWIPWWEIDSFQQISYVDVLRGNVPSQLLKNKFIFVGATAQGLFDTLSTASGVMSGVEVNASIFDALRQQRFIQILDVYSVMLVTFIAAFIIGFFNSERSPRRFLISSLICAALVITCSFFLLYSLRVWFPPAALVLSIFIFYPLWSWRRLEKAVAYLRDELKRVSHEKTLGFFDGQDDIDYVLNGLHFVSQVLPIQGWRVLNVMGDTVDSYGTIDQAKYLEPPEGEEWAHSATHSVKQFSRTDACYWVHVTWKVHSIPKVRRLLETAFTALYMQPQVSHTSSELISQTIQRLTLANQQVSESGRLVQQSLSKLQDAVIISDLCGRIIFLNEQAQSILPQDSLQQHLLKCLQTIVLKDNSRWDNILNHLLIEHVPFTHEANLLGLDGADEHFLCQGRLMQLSGRAYDTILITLTDVSELKRSEQARTEALHFLSHDLRSPLVSVLALLESSRKENEALLGSQLLVDIERYVRKNLSYAESFLQLARAESEQEQRLDPCDMHSVIDNAVAQVYHLASTKQISLKSERCDDDAWVLGDGELLERAVVNLLGNAIKYSDLGGNVTLSMQCNARDLLVSVKDQGIGIPQEDIPLLFDRFRRGSGEDSRSRSGAGLGLRFVAVVCEKHQGDISLKSELGKGSEFILRLPIYDFEEELN